MGALVRSEGDDTRGRRPASGYSSPSPEFRSRRPTTSRRAGGFPRSRKSGTTFTLSAAAIRAHARARDPKAIVTGRKRRGICNRVVHTDILPFPRELSSLRRPSHVGGLPHVLKGLSGVNEPPMIILMTTSPRPRVCAVAGTPAVPAIVPESLPCVATAAARVCA